MSDDINIDWERETRTGVAEAVYAETKSDQQLLEIINQALARSHPLLLTRVRQSQYEYLASNSQASLDYDAVSKTLILGSNAPPITKHTIGIVAAGTSDTPVATEVQRTLQFFGLPQQLYGDVGVAGLWRLTDIVPQLEKHRLLIAVAGMEGALFSVLSGLVPAPVIAVPTSVGYGVATGGTVALHSALASCSPGILTVNIDNGFGAAAAEKKLLQDTVPKHSSNR